MLPLPRYLCAAAAIAALFGALAPSAAGQGRIVQTLEAFFTPAAVAAAPDGRTLYVANAARTERGMAAGRGAVSKVRMGGDGLLAVEAVRFIGQLNSPLGVAVLPGPCGTLPAGTVAVAVGASWTVDADGVALDPAAAGTGVAFFDASNGQPLGRIFLGRGSAIEAAVGHALTDPAHVAADPAGSLYVADVAGARPAAQRADGRPGIVKLSAEAVSAMLDGKPLPAGTVAFASVEDIPAGIVYSVEENALYCATGNGIGALGGAVLRLPRGDFSGAAVFETAAKELGSLTGIVLSAAGKAVACSSKGDLLLVRGNKRGRNISLRPEYGFLSPGQPAAIRAPDGATLLVVPEMAGAGMGVWRHRVQVVRLPAGF
jgi:DNA-binding beta-propeller fold protein YncE